MNIPAKWRGYLYVAAIVISAALAVLIALGVVPQDKVLEVIAIVGNVIAAITGLLARLNLSPE